MDRKPKTIFQLDSPFTTTTWPQISLTTQDTILDILCKFLAPIGHQHTKKGPLSQGKRSRKRKKVSAEDTAILSSESLPPSDLASFIQVGLNSNLRTLGSSIQRNRVGLANASPPCPDKHNHAEPEVEGHQPYQEDAGHLAAVFVLSSSYPPILHAHLPQLIGLASSAKPELSATRLVQMTGNADERICAALGIHSVSCVGIRDGAPGSQSLLDLVRAEVPKVEIPWLGEHGTYLPVKFNAIETTQPVAKRQRIDPQGTL